MYRYEYMYVYIYICIYVYISISIYLYLYIYIHIYVHIYREACASQHFQVADERLTKLVTQNLGDSFVRHTKLVRRGEGLGSIPKKMYGERLGDGVEYHLMKPTPRR